VAEGLEPALGHGAHHRRSLSPREPRPVSRPPRDGEGAPPSREPSPTSPRRRPSPRAPPRSPAAPPASSAMPPRSAYTKPSRIAGAGALAFATNAAVRAQFEALELM